MVIVDHQQEKAHAESNGHVMTSHDPKRSMSWPQNLWGFASS